jgi:hypothetical protein
MKARIKVANNLVKSENDIYTGVIVNTGFKMVKDTKKTGRDVEEFEYQAFEMVVEFAGTTAPVQISLLAGSTINNEPVEVRYADRGKKNAVNIYNRFTTLLLKLDILKESELSSVIDDAMLEKLDSDIEKLNGRSINCKLSKNAKGFNSIDAESLELVKEK